MTIEKLKKRDGRLVSFDKEKIASAIAKAFEATYKPGQEDVAKALAEEVLSILEVEGAAAPEVEHIQDLVEKVLMDNGYIQTAKAYILYRNEQASVGAYEARLDGLKQLSHILDEVGDGDGEFGILEAQFNDPKQRPLFTIFDGIYNALILRMYQLHCWL